VKQWPGAWQTFATARDLRDPSAGVNQAILQTSTRPGFADGTIEIPYKDFMDSVDRGDSGMWVHEGAHLLGTGLPYPNVPKFYGEGIPDFVRFVALGEEPGWKFINATDATYFDKDRVWTDGYRQAAGFCSG
jgi:hypothetical protein